MIKAFLFDYDGVITAGASDMLPAERLARNLTITVEEAAAWIVAAWPLFITGKISEDEFWKQIEAQYGKPIDAAHRDIWYRWDELRPLPEMLAWLTLLKAMNYTVGVLSNVAAPMHRTIEQNGGYAPFDFTVFSHEIGSRKPEPEIFAAALKQLGGLFPGEAIFLDDRAKNVEAAQALGLHGVHVTSPSQAMHQVQEVLKRAV
jgi:putative hydrolase of the HAD superfamily